MLTILIRMGEEVKAVLSNELTELLQIRYPIIQAPMAGGITTAKLVAEVASSGGLGSIGAGYMTPEELREQIQEVKQLTTHFFNVNLFVPNEFTVSQKEIQVTNEILQRFYEQLGIASSGNVKISDFKHARETFYEQIQIIIEEQVPVCSFTFGIPEREIIEELKEHKMVVMGTATTVREAIAIEKAGMDIVIVQGSEAGGHRGNFISADQESLIGLLSLIPQVVDNVNIPVVAAGGIMDGRGLMAALCLGAKGVQMGTAFLTCTESGASSIHKEEILKATEEQLVLTRSFSGKWARGIKNKFISEMEPYEDTLPPFPVQNTLTKEIRKAASLQKNKDFMSLWSGQSPRLAKNQSVNELMKKVISEAYEIRKAISMEKP